MPGRLRSGMRTLIFSCLLLAGPAAAQPRVLDVEGVEGVWYPTPIASDLERAKDLVPELEAQVADLEKRATVTAEVTQAALAVLAQSERVEGVATWSIERYEKAAQQAEDRRREADAWYRAPELWGALGIVVGGALVAIASK